MVRLDNQAELELGVHSLLPGDAQKVPRAETYARLALLEHSQWDTQITFITDHINSRNNVNRGEAYCTNSINADLYHEIFNILEVKDIELKVIWIPSHTDDPKSTRELPPGLTQVDVLGNKKADELARQAANDFELPQHITANITHYSNLVIQIQRKVG